MFNFYIQNYLKYYQLFIYFINDRRINYIYPILRNQKFFNEALVHLSDTDFFLLSSNGPLKQLLQKKIFLLSDYNEQYIYTQLIQYNSLQRHFDLCFSIKKDQDKEMKKIQDTAQSTIKELFNWVTVQHARLVQQSVNQKQNERIHNVYTIDYIRHVVKEFINSDQTKKAHLKKMISDYFNAAKKELEIMYQEIYDAVDLFKFDNIIFKQQENSIIQKLVTEDFNSISCSEVAIVIPKLIKYTNFEDGHFVHLREYLKSQKQKIPTFFDGIILNLPYFRQNTRRSKQKEFVEISSEWLRQVNEKLKQIKIRPKKLRIKYIDDEGEQEQKVIIHIMQRQFIRNLCITQKISSIQQLELYCLWDIKNQDFQIAFFEALTRYPFLKNVNIYTGYKVTSMDYIDEIISEGTTDVRIYKKQWAF